MIVRSRIITLLIGHTILIVPIFNFAVQLIVVPWEKLKNATTVQHYTEKYHALVMIVDI